VPTSGFQLETLPGGLGESQEELIESTKEEYPLFEHVPYITQKTTLDYIAPLHLKILLKEDTPEARSQVLDWIRSKGVDPATHKIDWEEKL